MKIICTICSRHKKADKELLRASERYTGEHIAKVKNNALGKKLPLYFLSGKYGLISENILIPYYDYYLENSAIESLIKLVVSQIQKEGISEIEFYFEDSQAWKPYITVIEAATKKAQPSIIISHTISIDEAPEAYKHFDMRGVGKGEEYTKVVLKPGK